VLAPELAGGLSAERFTREVRLAARLQHPNVVSVLSVGTGPDGLPYYTMPFIDGASGYVRNSVYFEPGSADLSTFALV
jgi:serine/threonine-protein kinase